MNDNYNLNNNNKNRVYYFKLHEVIIMVITTCFLSFFAGSTIMELRMSRNDNKSVSKEMTNDKYLKKFYDNYQYILDNYYKDIDKEELINGAIAGMMGKLDDPYTVYMEDETYDNFNIVLNGSYKGLGIEIINIDDKIYILGVISNSPAAKAGLKAGDIIIKVNDTDVSSYKTTELSNYILDSKETEYNITVIRDGEEMNFSLNKERVLLESVASDIFERNNHKIGYIYISVFAANTAGQLEKKLNELKEQGIDSLIIDVRNNNGGQLTTVEQIASMFVDDKHVIYQLKKNNKITKEKSKGKETITYPIVVITNESSASASELLTGCLKDNLNATIIGKTTFGKGLVQELVNLSNGDQYKITTKEWLTPNGTAVNGVGINPDIEVDLDDAYYTDPSDENDNQLQEAINYLAK